MLIVGHKSNFDIHYKKSLQNKKVITQNYAPV